jgi:hypothetical protein
MRLSGLEKPTTARFLKIKPDMESLISKHSAIMDMYDPQKIRWALVVDEVGRLVCTTTSSDPGFLVQQNSLRDAVLATLNLNIFARHADRSAVQREKFPHPPDTRLRTRLSKWRPQWETFERASGELPGGTVEQKLGAPL